MDGAVGVELDTGVIHALSLREDRIDTIAAAVKIEIPEGAVGEGAVADQEAVLRSGRCMNCVLRPASAKVASCWEFSTRAC